MFDCQVIQVIRSIVKLFVHRNHKNSAFNGINYSKISQQPYMLWQNRLYRSTQLKMVSLLIWIVWCFEHIAKMAKFWWNAKSIIRRFHQFWVFFHNMRFWYHWNVQLALSEITLISLYRVQLSSFLLVEISKSSFQ